MITDEEFLSKFGEFTYEQIVDFSERVWLILEPFDFPTEEQTTAARNQAYLEIF
jgi:hypothetical protein